uniref:Uncharacterized protein n=1 Tax=Nicotiana tabacum TaxID=4097 RepID=A0A1S3XZ40_TOBAC|nr:PREDICTED: uncharacterized protein LOC107770330 [Nicotiana tabacum]
MSLKLEKLPYITLGCVKRRFHSNYTCPGLCIFILHWQTSISYYLLSIFLLLVVRFVIVRTTTLSLHIFYPRADPWRFPPAGDFPLPVPIFSSSSSLGSVSSTLFTRFRGLPRPPIPVSSAR